MQQNRPNRLLRRISLLLVCLPAFVGCGTFIENVERNDTLLSKAQLPPDSVVLDVFFVRVPFGDPQLNDELWRQVDEQHFPAQLRQRLARNGLRAGVVGTPIPMQLSNLLQLADRPSPSDETNQVDVSQLDTEPRVQRRHMSLRTGKRGDIVTSPIYDRLAVPSYESGQLSLQSYCQAQGHLIVEPIAQSDGRARLKLTPELRHGQSRLMPRPVIGNEAGFQLTSTQPSRVFDDLSIAATLSPGSMLIVSCRPDRAGSIGHHFFTCDQSRLEQKLLVVRLSQTQHDDSLVTGEILPLAD